LLQTAKAEGDIPTGLLYLDMNTRDLHELMGTVKEPLNRLSESVLYPGAGTLEAINESFR